MKLKPSKSWIVGLVAALGLIAAGAAVSPTGPIATELVLKSGFCSQMPCFIRMDSLVTGFAWDKMYVFSPATSEKRAEALLNVRPPAFTDGALKFAFLFKGKLVHFEEENYDLSSAHNNRVDFVLPKDSEIGTFGPSTVFNVSAGDKGQGKYFVLWDFCHLEQNGQAHEGPCPLLD